jgi:hypothetical protein
MLFRYIRQIQSIQLAEQQDCFQSNKVIYKFSITELTTFKKGKLFITILGNFLAQQSL